MKQREGKRSRPLARPFAALALALAAACGDTTVVDRSLARGLGAIDDCRFEDSHPPIVPVHAVRLLASDPTLRIGDWPVSMQQDYGNVWLAADGRRRLRVRELGAAGSTRPLPDYVPSNELVFGPFPGTTVSRLVRHGDDLIDLSWRPQGLVELSSREPGIARTLAEIRPDENGRRAEFDADVVGDEVVIVLSSAPARVTLLEGRIVDGRIRLDPARASSFEGTQARVAGAADAFQLFYGTPGEAKRSLCVRRRAEAGAEWSPPHRLTEDWSFVRDLAFTSQGHALYVAWGDNRHQLRRNFGIVNWAKPYAATSADGGITWSAGRCVADPDDWEDSVGVLGDHGAQIALAMWSGRPVLFWGGLEELYEAPQSARIRARALAPDLGAWLDVPEPSGQDVLRVLRTRSEARFVR